jgi:hypothetical protein
MIQGSRFATASVVERRAPKDRGGWTLLIPWAVLPIALAIITLVDWLCGRREARKVPTR